MDAAAEASLDTMNALAASFQFHNDCKIQQLEIQSLRFTIWRIWVNKTYVLTDISYLQLLLIVIMKNPLLLVINFHIGFQDDVILWMSHLFIHEICSDYNVEKDFEPLIH